MEGFLAAIFQCAQGLLSEMIMSFLSDLLSQIVPNLQ
jgi:hypothetical protein